MKPNEVKKIPREHRRNERIYLRISQHRKRWLIKNGYSPTRIFDKACEELGYKPDLKI